MAHGTSIDLDICICGHWDMEHIIVVTAIGQRLPKCHPKRSRYVKGDPEVEVECSCDRYQPLATIKLGVELKKQ